MEVENSFWIILGEIEGNVILSATPLKEYALLEIPKRSVVNTGPLTVPLYPLPLPSFALPLNAYHPINPFEGT
jgi:hypothetical protein